VVIRPVSLVTCCPPAPSGSHPLEALLLTLAQLERRSVAEAASPATVNPRRVTRAEVSACLRNGHLPNTEFCSCVGPPYRDDFDGSRQGCR